MSTETDHDAVEALAARLHESGPVGHLFSWSGCSAAWHETMREQARIILAERSNDGIDEYRRGYEDGYRRARDGETS